jgi:hypothetical protein
MPPTAPAVLEQESSIATPLMSNIASAGSRFFARRSSSEISTMSKEEMMNKRIRLVFVLAMIAASLSIAGQANVFGLSGLRGFIAAIVFVFVALIVAIPQLRQNFQSERNSGESNLQN